MKVKNESEDAQSCLTLSDPMDCSLPCSSIHGILQARVLGWLPLHSPLDWYKLWEGRNRVHKNQNFLNRRLLEQKALLFTGDANALCCCYCSVAKSRGTLWSHGLQQARRLCPQLSPRVCSNSCPLSWWCHPTISSSVTSFTLCLQPFPASGSFPMSQLFAKGG